MPKFGRGSLFQLQSVHPDLQELFKEVVKHFDCSIIEGFRGKEKQDQAYQDGKSQVKFPQGKHNQIPSEAVDVAPYPIDWDDKERFYYFAGFVKGIASQMDYKIRWGGDWNNDTEVQDTRFKDLVHFEIY